MDSSEHQNLTSSAGKRQLIQEGHFCPIGGVFGEDSSVQYREELRCLLGRRLRTAAIILTGGYVAFLVRNLIPWWAPPDATAAHVLIPHLAVTLIIGTVAVLLSIRSCLTIKKLRFFEGVLFGLSALFFVWMQHLWMCAPTPEELTKYMWSYPATTAIPWMILIHVYGLFIPNTWRRATGVIALMVAMPVAGAFGAAMRQPMLQEVLYSGGLSSIFLWLSLSAVTAIYGSHRFGAMRRESFDARKVGTYTLRQKLGSGGMGDVYLAEHQMLKRPCAIKLIRADKAGDDNAIARFESEVQAAAHLTHPNTIEIYDYGHTQDGTFYYAMEFLPGLNLQEMVERFGPLPPERAIHLLRQVCSALTEAHESGLIHRDIKPGNIFAAERGRLFDVAKLLDFGLVRTTKATGQDNRLTIDGTVIGSPLYAPPERVTESDELDARGDIYSLGATAYFILTGEPVFKGENPLKVLFAHANETAIPAIERNSAIPESLNAVIMKCLEKEPQNRFDNVTALAEALAACETADEWTQSRAKGWWTATGDAASRDEFEASPDDVTVTSAVSVQA